MTAQHQTVIQAEAMLFSELFHRGRFEVPWHQRYYDWGINHVRALLYDIDDAIKEDRDCYFLGAIMLVENGEQQWKINDGQQRMVTISLICAALCRRFADEGKGFQREGLALRLLFDLNANSTWTLDNADRYHPRISPPQNDAMRYRQMIRGNTIGTNGLLTTAWTEIENFFSPMSLEKSELYFDFLLKKLEVVCFWIPSHIDPNAVYETINCRGKKLDDLDLIRNYLYSHFNETVDSERKNSVHDNLERIRTLIPFTKKASEYMRCHLQCKFGFLPKDEFYRNVREAIRTQKDNPHSEKEHLTDYVFNLTQQIATRESLELFRKITAASPDSDFIHAFEAASGTKRSPRNLVAFLRELRGYTVTLPLVFAILIWYIRESDGRKRKRIAKIANRNLCRLATFVLRTAFVAPKFEPSHFETEFSNYARTIACAKDLPDIEFADFLRECDRTAYGVLNDSKFQDAMIEAEMTGVTKVKQFLLGINSGLQRDARLLNEHHCSIEHVLPKSPEHWGGWTGFNEVDKSDWVQKIGNLTLLGITDNKPGPKYNSDFTKKRKSYQDSSVMLTRKLGEYDDWNPAKIKARQEKMATLAVRVWAFE